MSEQNEVLNFANAVLIFLASLFGGGLGAYFKIKFSNIAKNEDFDKLLEQIEQTTKVTERIKADISHYNIIEARRWDFKHKFYEDLLDTLYKLSNNHRKAAKIFEDNIDSETGESHISHEDSEKLLKEFRILVDELKSYRGKEGLILSDETIEVLSNFRNHFLENDFGADSIDEIASFVDTAHKMILDAAKRDLLPEKEGDK